MDENAKTSLGKVSASRVVSHGALDAFWKYCAAQKEVREGSLMLELEGSSS